MIKTYNVLYVLNQDVVIDALCDHIKSNNYEYVVILSTHQFFRNEKLRIKSKLIDKNILFFIYNDFINDAEMENCDNLAIYEFRNKEFDNSIFMYTSLYYKNKLIKEKITKKFNFLVIFHISGLGIVENIWGSCLDQHLKERQKKIFFKKNIFSLFLKTINVFKINHNNKIFFFFGSINRLKIEDNIQIEYKKFNYYHLYLLIKLGLINSDFFCTTIHNYDKKLAENLKNIYVFIDGFHPVNFPKTYMDMYQSNTIFVNREFSDRNWFIKYERNVEIPPSFIKRERMIYPISNKIENIILILNHAGNWTSLINRSDTDVLIEAFIELSQCFQSKKFTIRLHPTMNHVEHDGLRSIERIQEYVGKLKYHNINVSKNNLDNDIQYNDLIISEYSNAFIDALKFGKLGIILNLTNRRNFMEDYSNIGFIYIDSFNDLVDKIEYYDSNLSLFIEQQKLAVDNYNKLQDDFYDSKRLIK